ncbi:histidine-type phosphatase, partial [Mycobacterium tuberculosis]
RYDRAAYAGRGLVLAGKCPRPGAVKVWADTDERTLKSAEAWVKGFAPGCKVKVGHAGDDIDPLFAPLEAPGATFDSARAEADIKARLGAGGLAAAVERQATRLQALNRVLGCCTAPVC